MFRILRRSLPALFLIICLAASQPAFAGPYEDGQAAYDNQDYATALTEYRKAADQGHAEAQNHLGMMYASGNGVAKDDGEAVRWYRKAAERGDDYAQSNLGSAYQNGESVSKDNVEAAKWYGRASEQGNGVTQSILGLMYETGDGVPKDLVLAHKWYNLSAASGSSMGPVSGIYRDMLETQMTPDQIAEAQRLAREWVAKKE